MPEPPPSAAVVTEVHGFWGAVDQVVLPAGAAANSEFNFAQINSVSCPSTAACVAVGQYTDGHGSFEGMAVAQSDGVWQRARELELPVNANSTIGDEVADLVSVSCSRPGNCVAVGNYGANTTPSLAMAVTERYGRWGRALQIDLPPGANTSIGHEIASSSSVACTGGGDCVATGQYDDDHNEPLPMVVTETNGRWARAIGIRAPAGATAAAVGLGPVACSSRGKCVGIGFDSNSNWVLTAVEPHGRWTVAPALPHRAVRAGFSSPFPAMPTDVWRSGNSAPRPAVTPS
jgi:hypothetical protein